MVLILVAACAAPGAAPAAAIDAIVRPVVARSYSDGGITLAAPQSAASKIDVVSAYRLCTSGVADCPGSVPSFAELALVSDSQYGQIDTAGGVSHSISARLSWVFTWQSIACAQRLGPRAPAGAPTTSPCDWLVMIDATSGEYLYTYSGASAL